MIYQPIFLKLLSLPWYVSWAPITACQQHNINCVVEKWLNDGEINNEISSVANKNLPYNTKSMMLLIMTIYFSGKVVDNVACYTHFWYYSKNSTKARCFIKGLTFSLLVLAPTIVPILFCSTVISNPSRPLL